MPRTSAHRRAEITRRTIAANGVFLAVAVAVLLGSAPAHATLTINGPWVHLASGTTPTEAYMELRSTEGAALVAITSERVGRIAIRAPGKSGKTLAEFELPPGETRALAPGSYRLQLAQINGPLKLGDRVPLLLKFRNADGTFTEIAVNAEVRRRSALEDHRHLLVH